MSDPTQVRSMFARIAGRYDLLNHLLSLGVDRRWRSRAVAAAGPLEGRLAVDACCGTGDLAADLAREGARVIGVDFTPEMLRRAGAKLFGASGRGALVHADALRLPLRDGCADVATCAFGLRNLADPAAGLRELLRVVRPGGRVVVLEFSMPRSAPLALVYRAYFTRILPWIGGLVSGDREAYAYLPRSVQAWPAPRELQRRFEEAGLTECGFRPLSGGIACLHWGRRRA